MIDEAKIEEWAKKMALGNNGGDWAKHYTEEQKEHWRDLVHEMINTIQEAFHEEG